MAGLTKKEQRKKARSITKASKQKSMNFQPVAKKIDVEEVKASWSKKPAAKSTEKKAEAKAEAPKKVESPKAEETEVKKETSSKKETAKKEEAPKGEVKKEEAQEAEEKK